jgi:hypothetical protein
MITLKDIGGTLNCKKCKKAIRPHVAVHHVLKFPINGYSYDFCCSEFNEDNDRVIFIKPQSAIIDLYNKSKFRKECPKASFFEMMRKETKFANKYFTKKDT